MIGIILGERDVAVYAVAKKVASKLPQLSLALIMGTMPVFAKINSNNVNILSKKFTNIVLTNTYILGCVSITIIAGAWFFIPLLFGSEYKTSVITFYLLIPYIFEMSYSIVIGSLLDYTEHAGKRAANIIITIIINILLNYIFIPRFGPNGAAIATSISYFPYLTLNIVEVRKILKFYRKSIEKKLIV
jgi:O-antigen/teichoic acid export membrane protein